MTASSRIRNISLSQLVLSPANVRKTPATAAEDGELEASIRAKGILQNLIVYPATGAATGVYEVHAGSRRLRILQKLAAEGVINADDKIPCKIEEPEDAAETSLAENTIRVAMHPADEFVAMAALIDDGATIEDVALRFGAGRLGGDRGSRAGTPRCHACVRLPVIARHAGCQGPNETSPEYATACVQPPQ